MSKITTSGTRERKLVCVLTARWCGIPEAAGRVECGSKSAAGRLGRQVGRQGGKGLTTKQKIINQNKIR